MVDDLQNKTEFGINHFAGPVVYDASNFMERNQDKIPKDLISLVTKTSNTLIRRELQELLKGDAFLEAAKKIKKTSIFEKFRTQLRSLLETMKDSQVRYIRCIKPNENLEPIRTDHEKSLRQLRCAG
jgi:myosin-5